MALAASSKLPRCFSCLRMSLQNEQPSLFSPTKIQVRGKKKLPRRTTLTVRLIENVKAYGSKGTILAVPPARMRNILYPLSQAAYMTAAEVKEAEVNELVVERDAGYGTTKPVEVKKEEERLVVYNMEMITPHRAREVLDKTMPNTMEFQRKPIVQDGSTELGSFIYGSVSSLDIMTDIAAQLAKKAIEDGFGDAAKVVLSAHDIQVDTEGLDDNVAETERIKSLGEFKITINIRNVEPLSRKVKVVPLKAES